MTVDLGNGDDGILFVNCQAREACVMLGDGDDQIRIRKSSAGKVFFDRGAGKGTVPRNTGFATEWQTHPPGVREVALPHRSEGPRVTTR